MTTMTDKPNCGNCPNKGTEQCPYDVICFNEDHCDFIQPFKRSDEFMKFSMACGLLCHPGARDWLMRDVLQELEKKMLECGSKVMFDRQDAYETAISLIRGVKE